jgi:CAAX prenyl protease N-terminal, five membrane helices
MPEYDSVMWTLGPLPDETQNAGRTYAKRLSAAVWGRVFLQFLGIVGYCYLGLPQWAGWTAKAVTNSFYLQVALCWIPVWIIYTACSLPASWQRFHLDRKFGLSTATFMVTLLDFLKAKALVFFFGLAVLEIMFASHRISPSLGWIWAGILCSFMFLLVDRQIEKSGECAAPLFFKGRKPISSLKGILPQTWRQRPAATQCAIIGRLANPEG